MSQLYPSPAVNPQPAALQRHREDDAPWNRATLVERARIRQVALDEATKLEERFALGPLYDPLAEILYDFGLIEPGDRAEATTHIRGRVATSLRDFAALLEDL